mmetsp:Transcript_10054/g.20544  ORF Transcript_10054/g.20544 Transcript_10054/m.20544 type:complete len:84 (+) Transcript_10054:34-285(+)
MSAMASSSSQPSSNTVDDRTQALDVVENIANILDVGLDRDALSALVELVENGCSPEALVAVVEELRKEKEKIEQTEGGGGQQE